jgi:ATP synthase protein I
MSQLPTTPDPDEPVRAPHTSVPSPHGGTEPHVPGVARQTDLGNAVIAYLLGGPLTFGGIGWLLDLALGTSFLLPVGVVVGMVLSLYVIWLRYGRS